jgi:hypothetical protein
MTPVTARDITGALRRIFPAPVRISARAETGPGSAGLFLVRLPSASASHIGGRGGLGEYLTRRLGASTGGRPVVVTGRREVRRRDCGRDVEFRVRIPPPPKGPTP